MSNVAALLNSQVTTVYLRLIFPLIPANPDESEALKRDDTRTRSQRKKKTKLNPNNFIQRNFLPL